MNFEDVLIRPVLSEKATALREQNKYTFIVAPSAISSANAFNASSENSIVTSSASYSKSAKSKLCGR